MKNAPHSAHGALERRGVPQIPFHALRVQSFQHTEVARAANKDTYGVALADKLPGDVASHKSRRAGDKRGHKMRNTSSCSCAAGASGTARDGVLPLPFPLPFPCPFEWPFPLPRPSAGFPIKPPIFPETVQLSIFHVSPSFLFPPSTAEASYPACTMQSSQRGSRPRPYFSQGVLAMKSLKLSWCASVIK